MKKSLILSMTFFMTSLCLSYKSMGQSYTTGATPNPYFIPVDTANKMLRSYLTSIHADADTNKNIQSLIMDADALRLYLSDTSIHKVKIMFAHTLDYINSGKTGINCGYLTGALTIIVAGYDRNNNYVVAPGNMVPDRSLPCPYNCPDSGTASDAYIH